MATKGSRGREIYIGQVEKSLDQARAVGYGFIVWGCDMEWIRSVGSSEVCDGVIGLEGGLWCRDHPWRTVSMLCSDFHDGGLWCRFHS